MRKVTVELKVKLLLNANDDADIAHVISDLSYDFFADKDSGADVEDYSIQDFEVVDSR